MCLLTCIQSLGHLVVVGLHTLCQTGLQELEMGPEQDENHCPGVASASHQTGFRKRNPGQGPQDHGSGGGGGRGLGPERTFVQRTPAEGAAVTQPQGGETIQVATEREEPGRYTAAHGPRWALGFPG